MSAIEFSKDEKAFIVHKIKNYFNQKLDQDIGQFDAEFLLEFFSEEIGSYYYNRGLQDARAVLESRLENIDEALYEIEKPTEFAR
ncbi:MAG: DUF2164 domain-containing protein [Candidatus Thiodiazotropha sp. (ex. Lucinisca nassula)]|nr:DUF2164 domain-containing protein [Candidatus Thiodiazotropha sp. (ex. Lucinisca nassula)]MBW9262283.1 DUF2164 domain-containing protein [Candidatus Thiodiazotropha sp. (ex. Lucinisca nassula)]MBW9271205.1 DUF2164 domain-containing protein [Candidatus Thiodiazotropha sp. (ex. Lucinisca nassula)]MCG7867845.1 DUF2164 domain-containing protein [Candidatus Thiodiazotropha taylori]